MKLYWSVMKRLHRLDRRPRVADRLGARWLLDPADWLDLQLLIGRSYEAAQLDTLTRLARAHDVDSFIDCGANFGFYTVLMAQRLPEAAIHAFEPVRATRYRLSANLVLNGLAGRVALHDCALGDVPGSAEIEIDPGSTGIAAIAPSEEERRRRAFSRSETVRVERLDEVLAVTGRRLALKIDVEGHEVRLLDGARRLLAENGCVVQVETRARNRDAVLERLTGLGFRQTASLGDDLFFVSHGLGGSG